MPHTTPITAAELIEKLQALATTYGSEKPVYVMPSGAPVTAAQGLPADGQVVGLIGLYAKAPPVTK
jgi:hypothetical protein